MSQTTYRVVIEGFPGMAPEEATRRVAAAFRIEEGRAARFTAQAPVVAKRGLPEGDAVAFRGMLAKLGAQARIEPETEAAAAQSPAAPPTAGMGVQAQGGPAPLGGILRLPEVGAPPEAVWSPNSPLLDVRQRLTGAPSDAPHMLSAGPMAPAPSPASSPLLASPPGPPPRGPSTMPPTGFDTALLSTPAAPAWSVLQPEGGGEAGYAAQRQLLPPPPAPAPDPSPMDDVVVCPSCGSVQPPAFRCSSCNVLLPAVPTAAPSMGATPSGVISPGPARPGGPLPSARSGASPRVAPAKKPQSSAAAIITAIIAVALVGGIVALVLKFTAKSMPDRTARSIQILQETYLPGFYETPWVEIADVAGTQRASFDVELPPQTCSAFVASLTSTTNCDLDATLSVGGTPVTADTAIDATPIVYGCNAGPTSAHLELWSYDGSACSFAVRRFEAVMSGTNEMAATVRVHAGRFLSRPTPVGMPTHSVLNQGTSERVEFSVDATGCYGVVAMSSVGTDIDVVVTRDNDPLGSDTLVDNFPIVNFCVPGPGPVTFEFSMYTGSSPYSWQVFRTQ